MARRTADVTVSDQSSNDPTVSALFVAVVVATGSIAINAVIPGAQALATEVGLPSTSLVGTFVAGYAVGHFLVGVFADGHLWRKLLAVGLIGFSVASLLIGMADQPETITLLRMLQGLCASVCPVIGRSLVRQIGTGKIAERKMSSAASIFAWAPVVAPIAASAISDSYGWRAIYVSLAAYGAAGAVWVLFVPAELFGSTKRVVSRRRRRRVLHEILTNRTARVGLVTGTLAFSGFFSFLAVAAELPTQMNLSSVSVAASVAIVTAGYALGGAVSRIALGRLSGLQIVAISIALMCCISLVQAVVVVLELDVVALVVCAAVYSLLAGAVMPNATLLVMNPSVDSAPTAAALLGMTKLMCSALFTWLAGWSNLSAATYMTLVMLIVAVCGWSFLRFAAGVAAFGTRSRQSS